MSPKYKIIYFDAKGIAETIRFLLSYMDEEFEEERIEFNIPKWLEYKPSTPFGKLPIVEIDGKRYTQSIPLYRYFGKKAKLAGNNDLEDLQIDIIADVISDVRTAVTLAFWESDEELKKTKFNTVLTETLPFNLKKLEEIAKQNNGYLANKKLSWVDFFFASAAENFNGYLNTKDYISEYPTLKALYEKVTSLPKVKAWIEKRKTTPL